MVDTAWPTSQLVCFGLFSLLYLHALLSLYLNALLSLCPNHSSPSTPDRGFNDNALLTEQLLSSCESSFCCCMRVMNNDTKVVVVNLATDEAQMTMLVSGDGQWAHPE
jgi:hypothetical protein